MQREVRLNHQLEREKDLPETPTFTLPYRPCYKTTLHLFGGSATVQEKGRHGCDDCQECRVETQLRSQRRARDGCRFRRHWCCKDSLAGTEWGKRRGDTDRCDEQFSRRQIPGTFDGAWNRIRRYVFIEFGGRSHDGVGKRWGDFDNNNYSG